MKDRFIIILILGIFFLAASIFFTAVGYKWGGEVFGFISGIYLCAAKIEYDEI